MNRQVLVAFAVIGVFAGRGWAQPARGVAESLGVRALEVFVPVVNDAGDGRLSIEVMLGGEVERLELRPASLRGPGFAVWVGGGDGGLVERAVLGPATYIGGLLGRNGARAAASVRDGQVHAVVILGEDVWGVQPVEGALGVHASYRSADLLPTEHRCGVDEFFGVGPFTHGANEGDGIAPAEDCNRVALTAFDADHEFFLLNGSVQATVDDIERVMLFNDTIYAHDTGIRHMIGDIIVRTDANDPYTTTDAGGRLDQFRNEWETNQTGIPRDVAHFFTGVDIDGGIIGVAWVGVVCTAPGFSYGLSQSRFTGNLVARVGLTAHELGHNWSAGHCDGDGDCFIMCSGIGGCSGNLTLFGSRSRDAIRPWSLGNGFCLDAGGAWPDPLGPTAYDDAGFGESGPVVFDVLGNDLDANCDALGIGNFDNVSSQGGTVQRSVGTGPGGRDELIYTPPMDGSGIDTFRYDVVDGLGGRDEGLVRVTLLTFREPDYDGPTEPGVRADYYNTGSRDRLPDFDALTPISGEVVSFINEASTNGEFAGSGLSDGVGAVYRGLLKVPTTGIYTLYLESDDGSRLLLGDDVIVDNDGLHGMVERSGVVGLRAGLHDLRVEFFENGGGAGLIARWSSAEITKRVIPAAGYRLRACAADLDGDGDADSDDFFFYLEAFAAFDAGVCDIDTDGDCDADDFFSYLDLFALGC